MVFGSTNIINVYIKVFADMDDECLPTISMNVACGQLKSEVIVKDEPQSETDSQHSSCPSSPHHTFLNNNDNSVDKYFVEDFVRTPFCNSMQLLLLNDTFYR